MTLVPDLAEANADVFTVARRSGRRRLSSRDSKRESSATVPSGRRARAFTFTLFPVAGNAFACFRDRKYSRENKKKRSTALRITWRNSGPKIANPRRVSSRTNEKLEGRPTNVREDVRKSGNQEVYERAFKVEISKLKQKKNGRRRAFSAQWRKKDGESPDRDGSMR